MYYVLLDKDAGQPWAVQFSDEDRETVEDELEQYLSEDECSGSARRYKIIAVRNDRQATIDAAVAKLNEDDEAAEEAEQDLLDYIEREKLYN